jgi:hypothetical protein
MADPVTLYKGDDKKLIASVDVAGWLADGWGTEKPEPEATPEPLIKALPESLPVEELPQTDAVEVEAEAETSTEAEAKTSVKRK